MIKRVWNSYCGYLKISHKESKYALSFGILGAFLETFSIYLLANLITNLSTSNPEITFVIFSKMNLDIKYYILYFLLSAILSAYLYYFSNKNIVKAKCKIERYVRQEITNLTLNIKWEYYLKISQGDISKSILSEGQNISEGYMYFLSAITYSVIALTYFLACLILVPSTFFILIIYALFAFRVYIYYSRKADKYGQNLSQITSNIGKWTSAIFNNLKYLRSISKDFLAKKESNYIFAQFANSYEKAMVASYKSKLITEILTIFFISIAITFILINGSNASNLILSLSLFVRMTPKVYNAQSRLLDSVAMISWPKSHQEKIKWSESYKESHNRNKFIDFDGSIQFKSVGFNYPKSPSILKEISLDIKKNECIGIIGKSGTGKSTIIDLITGIIKPKKGEIYLSGENIKKIDLTYWRSKLGIVLQENFFKNDSISSNISLESIIDKDKVKKCLVKANAWEFVKNLPNGIDEIILERGIRFSGGERQRLALARALYSKPKVLLLDEPSSGLDKISEDKFISSIKKIKGTMTIIIISHKKEVVNVCDRVLKLDNKGLTEL